MKRKKILGSSISYTMSVKWYVELFEDTFMKHGKPHIFKTYQGIQHTNELHISALSKHEIKISVNGKGRTLF